LDPQSATCTDTNNPQPAVTVSIPTGQTSAFFDIAGLDVAEDEVRFQDPISVVRDSAGNVYIADYAAQVVRRIDGGTNIISTFAGNGTNAQSGDGGPANLAAVASPAGLAIY